MPADTSRPKFHFTSAFSAAVFVALMLVTLAACSSDASSPSAPDPTDTTQTRDTTDTTDTRDTTDTGDTTAKGHDCKSVRFDVEGIELALTVRQSLRRISDVDPRDETYRFFKTDTLAALWKPEIVWDSCSIGTDRSLFIHESRPTEADFEIDSCERYVRNNQSYLRLSMKRWKDSSYANENRSRSEHLIVTAGPLPDAVSTSTESVLTLDADAIRSLAVIEYRKRVYSSTTTRIGTYIEDVTTSLDSVSIAPTARIAIRFQK